MSRRMVMEIFIHCVLAFEVHIKRQGSIIVKLGYILQKRLICTKPILLIALSRALQIATTFTTYNTDIPINFLCNEMKQMIEAACSYFTCLLDILNFNLNEDDWNSKIVIFEHNHGGHFDIYLWFFINGIL